jgi:RNA polymerase sigma factor (sigma-70 family)
MPETIDDFRGLMQQAQAGNEAALAQLCEHYEPKIRIVARVLLGPALRPHFDSLDLVQSVHRSLLVGLRQEKFDISTPENLMALATTMVRRKVARKWRTAQRQLRLDRSPNQSSIQDMLVSLSTSEADPARVAEHRDEISKLYEQLDETERRILELRSEGFTTNEVAEQLGLSGVALRVRMTRLRQRLRTAGVADEWV